MSRNLSTRHLAEKHSTLPSSLKSRTSISPKKANTKHDSKAAANKNSKQQLASTTPKITTSYTSKNKKDTTAESSPLELQESSQSSYEALYKGQVQKSIGQKEGSRLVDLCPTDKTKVGELIKKIAEEKEAKENFQQEMHRRQMEYEKTIEDLKKNNHDLVKSTLEIKDDFKNSMGLMKSVETLSSKQRQNKLFSNLISAKEQRTYDYSSNPLIANKENVFRQVTSSTPKSLTNLSGTPTSHMLPPKASKRFDELELDLQIAERRDKAFRPAISDKIVLDQEPEDLNSHSYKLLKFQKLQDDKKTSFDKFSAKPETMDTLYTGFSPMKTSFYSSKLSQPEERQEEIKLSRNPAKTFSSSHNNYLTTASPMEEKRKSDLYSPNKSEQYSVTIARESESGKENGQDWRNIMDEKNKYNKVFSSSTSNINRGMPPKSPSESYTLLRDTKASIRTDNNSPAHSQKRSTERNTTGRYSAEPSERMKEKREQEGSSVIPGVVDLGQMNVNQLVELKKIIDERIEIEELKNKSNRIRRSPLRNIQKADKIVKSPDNLQFSQKILLTEELLDQRSSARKDSSADRFRKTDTFSNRNPSRDQERESLESKQINSLGIPSQRDYYIKGKYGSTAGNFFTTGATESEGSKRSRDNSSRGKGSQGNITLEKDIEELYNQKLKEFLDVRDTLLKIKDSSSEASAHGKSGRDSRESKLSIDANDNNGLLSSNILYQFTSPVGTKSPMSMAPLKNEDLYSHPVSTQSAPITRIASKTAGESYGFREEKLLPQKNFSFANSGASSEKNSGLLNFGKKEDLNGTDLMKLVSNMEKNKAIRSEQRPVLEKTDKLTKKELDRLINKANTIEDSPERSPELFSKGDILHQLAQKNKDLFDPSSPIAKGFVLPEDSISLLETPTLNPLQYGSRSNSSMIETDLSIMAINNKIDEMREDLYENQLY